jgi:glycosyltransferase involved in cell wall biosynthesis
VTYFQVLQPEDQEQPLPADIKFNRIISVRRRQTYSATNFIRGLTGPWPLTVLGFKSRDIEKTLAQVLRSEVFDAVQIESIHLAFYLELLRSAPSQPLLVSDWHNIESELMSRYAECGQSFVKRLVALRCARLLENKERRTLKICNATTVPSERERQTLSQRCPEANLYVIPNGVDTAFYQAEIELERLSQAGSRRLILFVGSMDYHANIRAAEWFVQQVWPRIETHYPDIDFAIVGRDPSADVRQLASDRVLVTGTVADIRPFYHRAVVVVAPLLVGGGTRLKILEAMAAGVPVVSTTVGAEGIEAENNIHLLLANTREQFAAAVERLLISEEDRVRLLNAARNLVKERYDWAAVGTALWRIYGQLFDSPGKR